jgi:hypothetical protein
MKKLLLVLALVNATAFAAAAQTPQAATETPPAHGLTLGSPDWTSVAVTAAPGGAVGGQSGGGGRGGRYGNRASADYQPHMQQALANAYATAYPRPAPSSSMGLARPLRHASVALTNDGAKTVKSVRLDFVFTDPATGAEVNRIHHRSKKRLRPGESAPTTKEVMGSPRHRRGDGMNVSVEVTEVVYDDGSVWRR